MQGMVGKISQMQPSQVKIHLGSGQKKKKLRFKRIKVGYPKVMGVTEHSDFMYSFLLFVKTSGLSETQPNGEKRV